MGHTINKKRVYWREKYVHRANDTDNSSKRNIICDASCNGGTRNFKVDANGSWIYYIGTGGFSMD